MDLYFSPLAGSLAARIALYGAGADARFVKVDPKTKRTSDGSAFAGVHPLGLVPLLRLDDGSLLSEKRRDFSNILPIDFPYRTSPPQMNLHARQWLSFIGPELLPKKVNRRKEVVTTDTRFSLRIDLAPDLYIGPGKITLLETVATSGSISDAPLECRIAKLGF